MTFEEFLAEWRDSKPFISVHTSGSTGQPKVIELEKDFVRESALRTNKFFSLGKGSRLHSCVSADFIGGKMMAVRSELAGCRLTWEVPSNTPLQEIDKNETIDLLAVVPSQMIHLLDHLEEIPQINAIIIGGSRIHPSLRKRIAAGGLNAFETYGMTETASHIALRKVTEEEIPFIPLDGISISKDERDCLLIDFSTGKRIATNDMVKIDSNGGFTIIGRYDKIIITGGKKVNPEEIERRISEFITEEFYITSFPDEKWGERIVLKVEGKIIDKEGLRSKLKTVLRNYEMPKEIIEVERFERTENGKIKFKR